MLQSQDITLFLLDYLLAQGIPLVPALSLGYTLYLD